jgi:formylglycine-generating enzyme
MGCMYSEAMRRVAALLLACFVASGGACSLFVDTSGLSDGAGDASSDAPSSLDGGGDSGSVDAAGADAKSADGGGEDACGGTAGPVMVPANGYCIDSTEVTNTDYNDFLTAKNGDASGQPTYCSWNTSFDLKCAEAATKNLDPVTCVNFCDAYAYCAWAGKRLCGKIGGGAGAIADLTNPAADQWYQACSHAGLRLYPYGSIYMAGVCNEVDFDAGQPVTVGSLPGCVGGYDGLHDMVGNVVEWEDVCNATTGSSDSCYIRSGAFDDEGSKCNDIGNAAQSRNSADNTKGFRCCSNP